ncbi:hypothetical protein LP43_2077 [Methylophaga thiooxydans]|uniref:Uncharacterized protein n=1 Tax=Methylophaga thiooxydans TaxID=392484 RepID=A0A0A0BGJ2_9GAMM|nr:hypothetical protein [Methylophaga thiooxydans]KGM06204.1 hypothetical protein LP43_2077 [Methylophaga thiooxydans]
MSEAKIEIKIGEITFSGEGDSNWLSEQLDKIMDRAEDLISLAPSKTQQQPQVTDPTHQAADLSGHNEIASQTLPAWLRSKNAETVQNSKFLATAVWVEAKGQKRLQTKDVTAALSNANQKRLHNASECLNQNVKKGYCEKEGNQFYVTEEGKRSLGIN